VYFSVAEAEKMTPEEPITNTRARQITDEKRFFMPVPLFPLKNTTQR
jgi:hypothetical protein